MSPVVRGTFEPVVRVTFGPADVCGKGNESLDVGCTDVSVCDVMGIGGVEGEVTY